MSDIRKRIELTQGDITKCQVDAIVNAANQSLLGGGGVDGAIHRAAGPELLAACRNLGGCATGEAKITRGYRLPAKHVIHAVGPRYRDGKHCEPDFLASCYRQSLWLAAEQACRSVAFPAISCGIYGYPIGEAAEIALCTIHTFLNDHDLPQRVLLVLFDQSTFDVYAKIVARDS